MESSGPKRNRTMELNKALSIMGFGTWNNLEPDNDKKSDKSKGEGESASSSAHSAASVVDKLNKTMFHKLQEIEAKRERTTALERKIFKMVDGPKKKAIVYQKQQGAML